MSKANPFVTINDFIPKSVQILRSGYSRSMLTKDIFAGITVGVIALPLAIAFAIGAGATPAQGLWTAIIAGFAISALGGSRYQVAGPTGAFVVIIAGVIADHGMDGLIAATAMAGVLLVIMGASGLGKLIKFIPYPVTIGFTTGIGVIIAGGQIKDFFGLSIPVYPAEFFARIAEAARYSGTLDLPTFGLGAATVACILLLRKFAPKIPGAIVAVALVSAATYLFKIPVETIGSRYGAIPKGLPTMRLPIADWATIRAVFPSAVTIALLGSIESLLSAVVADGMTGDRHNANMELVAQGAGNVLSSLFGGIPATGAIARTAANIKNGSASPISGMIHAIVLFVFTLFLSGLASAIPLTALSAILLVVAWDMSELRHFLHMRYAPKSDLIVMLVTFGLTVAIDLTVAVEVGVLLAVFLFIRRVSETSAFGPVIDLQDADSAGEAPLRLPKGVEAYEISGPFFFGTADLLQEALEQVQKAPKAFILRLRRVPSIDATGINALATFRTHCSKHGTTLILSGVLEQPRKALDSIGLTERIGPDNIFENIDSALERAAEIAGGRG
ncbi:MAG: sodium-independent anion transporter [Spirochaetae bacterium HGW-Spirochaetae-3]|jgi:SulP family sulfate permease|nr:MAG: sodium-independent anion transporter [Spirochaetae bacterium HGW-Spirochaetae-3]